VNKIHGILMLTVKGYVCKCPECGKEYLSTLSMRHAENHFERHVLKKHPSVEGAGALSTPPP